MQGALSSSSIYVYVLLKSNAGDDDVRIEMHEYPSYNTDTLDTLFTYAQNTETRMM